MLTKQGKKMKRILTKEYGHKKGLNIFFALEHTHPNWAFGRKRK